MLLQKNVSIMLSYDFAIFKGMSHNLPKLYGLLGFIVEHRRPERQAEPHKHPVYGNLRKSINEFSHGYYG